MIKFFSNSIIIQFDQKPANNYYIFIQTVQKLEKMVNVNANKPSEVCITFREQFFENIKSLYKAERLCDVTLIADEKR